MGALTGMGFDSPRLRKGENMEHDLEMKVEVNTRMVSPNTQKDVWEEEKLKLKKEHRYFDSDKEDEIDNR